MTNTSRLLVQWRNDVSPAIHPIGCLSLDDTYVFEYLAGVVGIPGFRPLLPFPDVHTRYESVELFDFFAARTLDPRRPDYLAFLEALDLRPPCDALVVLGRSGGRRKGDFISLVEEPRVDPDGRTEHTFLVHGVRHVPDAAARDLNLARIRPGDPLDVVPEPANPVNADALLVVTPGGVVLGWIPDGLISYAARLLGEDMRAHVVRINGPEQPDQLRLLIRVTGRLGAGEPPLPALPDPGASTSRAISSTVGGAG